MVIAWSDYHSHGSDGVIISNVLTLSQTSSRHWKRPAQREAATRTMIRRCSCAEAEIVHAGRTEHDEEAVDVGLCEVAAGRRVRLHESGAVIKYRYPPSVLKDTYDHSCY